MGRPTSDPGILGFSFLVACERLLQQAEEVRRCRDEYLAAVGSQNPGREPADNPDVIRLPRRRASRG